MYDPAYEALFTSMHPGFFDRDYIKNKETDEIYEEMLLPLKDYDPASAQIPVPAEATFGFYRGDWQQLLDAVRQVDAGWVPIYEKGGRVYCGFVKGQIASFCLAEEMGRHMLNGKAYRFAGPGCVGTLPAFRRQGIGLKMVADVTALLQAEGFDYSYIHYTGVGPWYAKLGYRTCLQWNRKGPVRG